MTAYIHPNTHMQKKRNKKEAHHSTDYSEIVIG